MAARGGEEDHARREDAAAERDAHEEHDDEDREGVLLVARGALPEEAAEVTQESREERHGVVRVTDLREGVPRGDAAVQERTLAVEVGPRVHCHREAGTEDREDDHHVPEFQHRLKHLRSHGVLVDDATRGRLVPERDHGPGDGERDQVHPGEPAGAHDGARPGHDSGPPAPVLGLGPRLAGRPGVEP